jgi:tripartite ATP-independent transporter DctP family solute receptor
MLMLRPTKRQLLRRLVPAVLLSATMLTAVHAGPAEAQDRRLKFGYSVHETNPLGKGATRFSELVAEKSGQKIAVRNYPATQLGSETQMISATQGGVQEMVGVSSAPLVGLVKEFALFDLPFFFADAGEADAVLDGPVGRQLLDKLTDKGLVGLCFWENGFRHVTNSKHPIGKPEDIEGLKLRTMQNPVYIDAFNTLGANAVPMPWPEVYSALETGAIDAQENPFSIVSANKLDEVQKYLSVTRHGYSPYVVMVGKKLWDKLDDGERTILQDSCVEARDYQRKLNREEDAKIVAELGAKGMQINELTPDQMARLKQMLEPVVAKYTKEVGEDLVNQARAEIEKVRGKN